MNELKCRVENCQSVFQTEDQFAPGAKYTCRNHMPKIKQDVFFQRRQFDKDLKQGRKPAGTSHVQRQGEVEDPEWKRVAWATLQEETKQKE